LVAWRFSRPLSNDRAFAYLRRPTFCIVGHAALKAASQAKAERALGGREGVSEAHQMFI